MVNAKIREFENDIINFINASVDIPIEVKHLVLKDILHQVEAEANRHVSPSGSRCRKILKRRVRIMNKAYKRINWENYPSDATPLNEANLNNLDSATDTIDDRVITLDTTKVAKTEVATLVSDVTFEESTGIITITKKNGSRVTIDTQMEKIAVNFTYNPTTQQIILALIDGTKQYIDLSTLITQYEFLDTDTVAFTIGTDGKVSAIVKEGSIEEKHLEPNYLAKIKVEAAKAETSQADAAASATKAESYAVGGTGSREGEDTDNAAYYYRQAKSISESFAGALRPMGTVAFANLPALTDATAGDMYNISDEFTTTDDFKEGSGNAVPAGANIYKTSDGKWDVLAGTPVTGVKGAKENVYRRGNVSLSAANIGAVATGGDTASNVASFTSSDDETASSWTSVVTLTSGEKHSSIFAKVSQMFKNVRYLYKMLGTTDISGIGGGTVTGAIVSQNIILGTKGGSIGYASDCSLESAVNQFISDMAPYVPYLIHGDNIGGVPVDGTPNDVTIEVIVLNKLTNAYRIVLYNNKGTDIHTICRIDGGWKSWVQIA